VTPSWVRHAGNWEVRAFARSFPQVSRSLALFHCSIRLRR
jgi:hypothetical protein